ncbi:MAG TPA: class I SAM-dependent methyltransferase [Tepidisphaeraceae bacterium]|nr:class I SAM-dependent methyltransferase [Tepidisphaeraceae bacterium]
MDDAAFSALGIKHGLAYPFGLLTPGTIYSHACMAETRGPLIDALRKTELDDIDRWRLDLMERGLARLGDRWDFADNVTIAHAFAQLAAPKRVLEIGVRRGFCTAAVAAGAPDAEIHLIDMWMANYSGVANPGPDLIRQQLDACGHRGPLHIHSGDSHAVLPELFGAQPNLTFDLILVDGDHTAAGAALDLAQTAPRLAAGGLLVFDDLVHPGYPHLLSLWRQFLEKIGSHARSFEYLDHGRGVGLALRVSH